MDKEKDNKIKNYFQNDKVVSDKANKVFDDFISQIQNEEKGRKDNVVNFEKQKTKSKLYYFKKLTAIAASLIIVILGSNAYARTLGYDNIFFLIIDMVSGETVDNPEEIFSDKDIVISYNSFNITDDIEMQINELQVKDNTAKLYLLVKELNDNSDVPLNYIVKNEKEEKMYEGKSSKKNSEKVYTEVLELTNYKEDTNIISLEIFNKSNVLIKTVKINLAEKTIEARTENPVIKQISQIELKKFLQEETEKINSKKSVIILETYDIFYSDSKYIVKYLFIMPTEEDYKNNTVEDCELFTNTIEFKSKDNKFELVKIEKPELFE